MEVRGCEGESFCEWGGAVGDWSRGEEPEERLAPDFFRGLENMRATRDCVLVGAPEPRAGPGDLAEFSGEAGLLPRLVLVRVDVGISSLLVRSNAERERCLHVTASETRCRYYLRPSCEGFLRIAA